MAANVPDCLPTRRTAYCGSAVRRLTRITKHPTLLQLFFSIFMQISYCILPYGIFVNFCQLNTNGAACHRSTVVHLNGKKQKWKIIKYGQYSKLQVYLRKQYLSNCESCGALTHITLCAIGCALRLWSAVISIDLRWFLMIRVDPNWSSLLISLIFATYQR